MIVCLITREKSILHSNVKDSVVVFSFSICDAILIYGGGEVMFVDFNSES